jgi:hypothetical protein
MCTQYLNYIHPPTPFPNTSLCPLVPVPPGETHSFLLFSNCVKKNKKNKNEIIFHLFTYAYIVWVISSPCSPPQLYRPLHPHFKAEPVLPLSLILLKKRHKHDKEDKVYLLVEIRIAIQKYS